MVLSTTAAGAMDCPTAFQDLLKNCRVNALLCSALSDQGYRTIADFAWAFPSVERLAAFTTTLPETTAQSLSTGDLDTSVEIALPKGPAGTLFDVASAWATTAKRRRYPREGRNGVYGLP